MGGEGGYGVAEGEKSRNEHLLAILQKREEKKNLQSGLGWLAGIRTRHHFSDQSDIKPT